MLNNHKKLHLGCGSVNFAGWLNIDLESPTADANLNLTKPLPFADGSITHIFNEHFIEHISRAEVINFLTECRRILCGNGVIRITTPNLRFLIASYLAGNKDEWDELWQPDTLCLMMNEGMRSWGHQFVYDAEELVRILVEVGFNSISFQEYRKSQDKELCGLESRPFHNELIIEARKTENPFQSIDFHAIKNNEDQWIVKLENDVVGRYKKNMQFIADQARHIHNLEIEIATRGDHITDQARHIHNLEIEIATRGDHITDQARHIHNLEIEIATRGDHITDQARHIQNLEITLMKYQNSLYEKYLSFISRLYSTMRIK
jgi:predicted SAM-dependent methyltransferase